MNIKTLLLAIAVTVFAVVMSVRSYNSDWTRTMDNDRMCRFAEINALRVDGIIQCSDHGTAE